MEQFEGQFNSLVENTIKYITTSLGENTKKYITFSVLMEKQVTRIEKKGKDITKRDLFNLFTIY